MYCRTCYVDDCRMGGEQGGMKRHEYIRQQANELAKLCKKREAVSARRISGDLSPKQCQKLEAELNWLGMHIGQTEERLLFALGRLQPHEAREEWQPSAWHRYDGIRAELERIEFEF